jgi:hypothetical protein
VIKQELECYIDKANSLFLFSYLDFTLPFMCFVT